MFRTTLYSGLAAAVAIAAAGCSGAPQTPVSPSRAVPAALGVNSDGSTLKVSAPIPISPIDGGKLETRQPLLTFTNSSELFGLQAPLQYEIQVTTEAGELAYATTVNETPSTSSHTVEVELALETNFLWRVRPVFNGQAGPWSTVVASFRTPDKPRVGGVPGVVGPPRTISMPEAVDIIKRIHDELGFNLGRRSTREQRIAFLFSAVAAVHYGHPRWNPAGPDPLWCVKDAGGGRPPSDDVIVRCDTRDAWDLILGVGADGYRWHPDYIGRLSTTQNVYPPPVGALGSLPNAR